MHYRVIVLLAAYASVLYGVLLLWSWNQKRFDYLLNSVEPNPTTSPASTRSLAKNASVFCWVVTAVIHYKTRVPAVSSTWLKRCDHGLIFSKSSINDSSIPHRSVFHNISDSYGDLFYKSVEGFRYAYEEVSPNFDWYYKVDDDTYIVVENLKKYLKTLDPGKPYYIGCLMQSPEGIPFHTGGTGYALSNAAVKLFVEKGVHNRTICPFDSREDVGMAVCLQNLGIYPHYSAIIQQNFFPEQQLRRLNKDMIAFHYQSPRNMHKLEKFFYGKREENKKSSSFKSIDSYDLE